MAEKTPDLGTTDPAATSPPTSDAQPTSDETSEDLDAKLLTDNLDAVLAGFEASTRPWYQRTKPWPIAAPLDPTRVLSYGVRIGYKLKPATADILVPFLDESGTINVMDGLFKDTEFLKTLKKEAVISLLTGLEKSFDISSPENMEIAAGKAVIATFDAGSFYVDPRPRKSIYFKVLFSANWVDSLVDDTPFDFAASVAAATRTAVIQAKDLSTELGEAGVVQTYEDASSLSGLIDLIGLFGDQALKEGWVLRGYNPVCEQNDLRLVQGALNELLTRNNKKAIDANNLDYLQFGFDDSYNLVYIAHNEELECLCDANALNGNILKVGFSPLKIVLPFVSQRVNAFLYYLPEIHKKYKPLISAKTSTQTGRAHSTEAAYAWSEFTNKYVHPPPIVEGQFKDAVGNEADRFVSDLLNPLTEPLYDALAPIGEGVKEALLYLADSGTDYVGDTEMEEAFAAAPVIRKGIESNPPTLQPLWDMVINKISISELTRLATQAALSCLNLGDVSVCQDLILEYTPAELQDHLISCLQEQNRQAELNNLTSQLETTRVDFLAKGLSYLANLPQEQQPESDYPALFQAYKDAAAQPVEIEIATLETQIKAQLFLISEESVEDLEEMQAVETLVELQTQLAAKQAELIEIEQGMTNQSDFQIAVLEEKLTAAMWSAVPPIPVGKDIYVIKPQRLPGLSAQELAELNALYCADKDFADILGAEPDAIIKATIADYLSEAAVCFCILRRIYGGLSYLLETLPENWDEVQDFLESAYDRAEGLVMDTLTLPVNYTLEVTDFLKDIGDNLLEALKQIAYASIAYLVLEILKSARDEIRGSLASDLCGTDTSLDPFTFVTPFSLMVESPNNNIADEEDACRYAAAAFDEWGVPGLHWDTPLGSLDSTASPGNNVCKFFGGLAKFLSISEFRRGLEEPCIAEEKEAIVDEIMGYTRESFPEFLSETPGGPGLDNPATVNSILAAIGSQIDPMMWDLKREQFETLKAALANQLICLNNNEGIKNQLADGLSGMDIDAQLNKDRDDLLSSIGQWKDVLDPNKVAKAIPPLFCGPCSPEKEGMQPILGSQTHPSQEYLNDTANSQIYKTIDASFQNETQNYVALMLESQNNLSVVANLGADPDGENAEDSETSFLNEIMKKNINGFDDATAMAIFRENINTYADTKRAEGVAQAVVEQLLESAENASIGQLAPSEEGAPSPGYFLKLNSGDINLWIVFNYSPQANQAYFVLQTADTTIINTKLFDLNLVTNPFSDLVFSYIENTYAQSASKTLKVDLTKSYPQAMKYLIRTNVEKITTSDLFLKENFNKLTFADEYTPAEICDEGPIDENVSILGLDKVQQKVSYYSKELECRINRGASPDAMTVANLMGFYEILIKVFIAEEYLKNIFAFTFLRISDVFKNAAYMDIVVNNVWSGLANNSAFGAAYETYQKYLYDILDARYRAGEKDIIINNSEDAVRFMIRELAEEVGNNMTVRLQALGLLPEAGSVTYEGLYDVVTGEGTLGTDVDSFGRLLELVSPNSLTLNHVVPQSPDKKTTSMRMIASADSETSLGSLIDTGATFTTQEFIEVQSKFSATNNPTLISLDEVADAPAGTKVPEGIVTFLASAGYTNLKDVYKFISSPMYSFLTRPGTAIAYDSEGSPVTTVGHKDSYVWAADKSLGPATVGAASVLLPLEHFKYRGKISLEAWNQYYGNFKNYGYGGVSFTNDGDILQDADLWQKVLDSPLSTWFTKIGFGKRLLYVIGSQEDKALYTNIINDLNVNQWDDAILYYKLCEDKVLQYTSLGSAQMEGSGIIAIPIETAEINLLENLEDQGISAVFSALESPLVDQLDTTLSEGNFSPFSVLPVEVNKMLTQKLADSTMFKKLLPIKDILGMIALLERQLMVEKYPALNTVLLSTKARAMEAISAQISVTDASYDDDVDGLVINNPLGGFSPAGGGDLGAMVGNFLKLALGAAANTMDPTWTTPWFVPGPVTPVGVLAKILYAVDGSDTSPADADPCADDEATFSVGDITVTPDADDLNLLQVQWANIDPTSHARELVWIYWRQTNENSTPETKAKAALWGVSQLSDLDVNTKKAVWQEEWEKCYPVPPPGWIPPNQSTWDQLENQAAFATWFEAGARPECAPKVGPPHP